MAPIGASPVAFIAGYVTRRAASFGTLASLVVTAASCGVAVQYGMKLIVDSMAAGDRLSSRIWVWLGLFIGLIAAESACWRGAGWLGCRAIVATGVDVRADLFRHLTGHPMSYFAAHLSGALGNRITATAGAVGAVFSVLTWRILPPLIDFAGAGLVLTTVDWRAAAFLVGSVSLLSVGVLKFGLKGRHLQSEFAEKASQVNGELVDVVSNIWTVKAFSGAAREWRRLQQSFSTEAAAQRKSWLYLEKGRALHDICLSLTAAGVLVWAVHSWKLGLLTTGDVVVVSALTFRVLHGSRDLALALVDAAQQVAVIAEMLRVVSVPHKVVDLPGARPFEPRAGSISIQEVDFAYADGPLVLRRFSLDVPPGQRCGIVGASGAGKSTLVSLIQRLDDVQRGFVHIDEQDIKAVQQSSLRAAIAVVPQDISLLHRSILANIWYSRPNASREEVIQAARDAACDEFIRNLPEGYETPVGERGVRLSGGQRQRIGIARAFLKRAPILLLDEATSALDSHSEREIELALERLMSGRTVIAIAHRLSTVANFDRIVVLDGGRIVEDGSPAQLRRADGLYARLWRLQSKSRTTS
jgi:ATP-binding cassette subfamily B protein